MAEASISTEAGTGQGSLMSLSFIGLTATQLLTAVNDNIFRWLVIGIGKDYVEQQDVGLVLMAGTACFVLPYLLLAAPAGYFADRFSKRSVIVACKIGEIAIMALGIAAIWIGNLWFLFVAVALMGAQSALFSPAKMGCIPEILRSNLISAANGVFGLATVVSTVVGMAAGSALSDATGFKGQQGLWLSALVLLGVAMVGTLFSLLIRRLPAANPERPVPWDTVSQTYRDVRTLVSQRNIFRVALGMVFFWSVGTLATLNIDQFAAEGGALNETAKTPLLISLVIGVGAGSVLAGIWSAGRVELGIVPIGALGVAVGSILLFAVQGTLFDPSVELTVSFVFACGLLLLLGTSAGLFDVPLEAYMQQRAPAEIRGSILAAANLVIFSGVLAASVLYYALRLPASEGSLENIAAVASADLSADEEQRLTDGVERFESEWGREDQARMEDHLPPSTARAAERDATLANLLWIEIEQLQKRGMFPNKHHYYKRFPKQALLVKNVFDQASGLPLFDSQQIFLLFGCFTIPVLIYTVWRLPQATVRMLVWIGSWTVYRIRIQGKEHIPERGGALLISNHVSWLDGFLFLLSSPRPVRLLAFVGNFRSKFIKRLAESWGVIMVASTRPKALKEALDAARDALKNGELVCMFPEGGITRTGQIQGFRRGLLTIVEGTGAPIVPTYLDQLWGSIFSFEGGKFFWKWPRRWPYPISIHFGEPLTEVTDVHQVRQAVQALGASAVSQRPDRLPPPPVSFVRQCKRRKRARKAADSTGADLTGSALLTRTLVARRLLRRHILADDETHVALLLPPSIGGVVANMALALDRRVAVNLNYTVKADVLNFCNEQCGVKHVLTSRKFMEKMNYELDAELVYLEDLREKPTLTDKLSSWWHANITPCGMLERGLGLNKIDSSDVLTVIFTSGSTGKPKGVMLTHGNIASNVEAVDQVINLQHSDVLLGILPFFHSLGYTVTLWGGMGLDISAAYHFSPLDSKQVGKLCEKYGGTLLLATPTFLRSYLRRCSKEQFGTLDTVVAGAEKLPGDLCDAFEEKFDVRPVEGYGTTELSPLVSVNIPPSRSSDNFQDDCKEGTVGRPVPGVSAKVLDLDSGDELPAGQPGMLWITGPNVMKGYLNRQDLTEEVIVDGWYNTGDVAVIDDDGFIKITGRISRFSKIGGEMVPHIVVEEAINEAIGLDEEAGLRAAVTAVADAKKGERLIVVHTAIEKSSEEIRQALGETDLPNLFLPSADSFMEVDELPILGSGKFDLKRIKQLAEERFGGGQEAP